MKSHIMVSGNDFKDSLMSDKVLARYEMEVVYERGGM